MALPRLQWRPLIVGGVHDPELRAALHDASGAYAIRVKRSGSVVYVGESSQGVMWKTLTRHFNAPESFKKPKAKGGGGNAFAVSSPEDYEIAYRVTSRGHRTAEKADARALALEGRWIEAFYQAGHPLKNDEIPVDDSFDFGANVKSNPGGPPHRHYVIARENRTEDGRAVRVEIIRNHGGTRWWRYARFLNADGSLRQGFFAAAHTMASTSSKAVRDRWLAEFVERDVKENPSLPARVLPSGALVELGFLTRLGAFHWPLKSAPVLAYDSKGRLFIVYAGKIVRPSSSAERREYARTHWGAAGRGDVRGGMLADPPFVVVKDAGGVIQYTTRKGGDREIVDYVHAWGEGGRGTCVEPVIVEHQCGDRRCRWNGAIALLGGSYRVSERGIVG